MGDKITLKVDAREVRGKKVRGLRQAGITPGVVYGAGVDAQPVQAAAGEVAKVFAAAGRHTPIHLTGAKRRIAMIKSIDRDPVKHDIRHIALHAVRADEPVVAEVPVRLVGIGESEAEKAGLVVLQAIEHVTVKALPMDLPEALEVSVAALVAEGDRLTVGDLTLPDEVELVDNDDGREGTEDDAVTVRDLVVASVYEPGALQAANEAAGGEAETADADSVAADNGAEETSAEAQASAE